MTYATLMVHLELGASNAGLLRIAGDLAGRFDAGVIGIAACQPMQQALADGYLTGEVIQQDLDEIGEEIGAAEAEFRAALEPRIADLEWRSAILCTALSDYLAREARAADLVITKVDRTASLFDSSRHVDMGDLVMQAGRPVLIVPTAQETLDLGHVMLGWRDTPEARRAASSAVPMLRLAERVTVVEITRPGQLPAAEARLKDVVAWLGRHGVPATPSAASSTGNDAGQFDALAREQGAGLVVAGAYGHSRMREWVLGGVTRDLLLSADRCALVAH